MFTLLLFGLWGLATCVIATPVPQGDGPPNGSSGPTRGCDQKTDTFDDLGASWVPRLHQIGHYDGVIYDGFLVDSDSLVLGNTHGIIPQSGCNVATAVLGRGILQLGTLSLRPFGSIVAAPSNSFDLISFYFGCAQNEAILQKAGAPLTCVITVTGFAGSRQVPEEKFTFTPTDPNSSQMLKVVLPASFNHLQNVTFGVATTAGLSPTTILDLDDVVHCNNS